MVASTPDAIRHVRSYYERNTRLFLRFNRARHQSTIHRAVWAEGVASHEQALFFVNQRIAAVIACHAAAEQLNTVRVLDLGCGVGGTLMYVAQHVPLPMHGLGVSISPTQVRLANEHAAASDLSAACWFVEANYLQLPCAAVYDVAVAVEALVHAPDLARALAEAAVALKPGGYLLICDDMLADSLPPDRRARGWIATFRRGWRAPSVVPRASMVALAQQAGLQLVEEQDLTPFLRLLRLPLAIGQLLLWLGRHVPEHWPFVQSLIGGLALQYCLAHGAVRYRWLVFQKQAANTV